MVRLVKEVFSLYHIGILQLTQNLDDAVRGFKHGMAERGLTAQYHYLNADGNVNELPKLAAKLASLNVDLIFACSTPSAKAAVALPESIPVVFTPVFDPVGAGLVRSMDHPGGKATGVSGMVKADDKAAFIKKLIPHAQTVGVLYHSLDSNAFLETGNFRKAAEDLFTLVELPVSQPEDLSKLADILNSKLDALFLPIGRIIEDNFATVLYYTDALQLPVIASHAPNIPFGALGGLVANHFRLGEECAEQARHIINGSVPGEIPVGIVKKPDILLNHFAAQNLDIEIPPELAAKAKEIFE